MWAVHAIERVFGLDSGAGVPYLWWSGFGGFSSLWVAVYRRHNCHSRWCWRVAHHDLRDGEAGVTYRVCHRHHPTATNGGIRRTHLARLHREHAAR